MFKVYDIHYMKSNVLEEIMKRSQRRLIIVGMFLAALLVIGGIIAAAVAVGANASEKTQRKDSTEVLNLITNAVTVSPIEAPECTQACKNVPSAIHKFAHQNNISVTEWSQDMIDLLNRNPETEEFVLNYPYLKDQNFDIDLSDCGYETRVPHFLQWDQRWGYTPYGDGNIAIAGCGPTCLSMVYTHLTGDISMNPKAMAEFATDYGYCEPGNGSAWALIFEGGEILGLEVEEVGLDEDLIAYHLEEGRPIIAIMGPGDFTQGGHYIVMTDYIDGQIKINDPNSITRTEKLWNYADIESQIEGLWACSND